MSFVACSASSPNVGRSDAGDGGDQVCTGVCASASDFTCASSYATSACLGHNCCILAADAGPPYLDEAGSCPGLCASPDDIACPGGWSRTSVCAVGDLCCGGMPDAGDAGDAHGD
jgi:hypothetical protein